MPAENLGNSLSAVQSFAGGQAQLFERGLIINGVNGELEVSFNFPMIGHPHIAAGNATVATAFESNTISFRTGAWDPNEVSLLVNSALTGRLSLIPSDQSAAPVPLSLGPVEKVPRQSGSLIDIIRAATHQIPALASLKERQLYDVALRDDAGQWHVVAPNAVYYRSSWHDFGIAHITDVHVARRIDTFRGELRRLGRHDAANKMYNWNDRFRGFIKYANFMHSIGVLDVIMATGDLFDYIYEKGEETGEGNAGFLRELLLGQAPGPDFPNERLQVPIFMVAGNHDYRKHPYELLFNLVLDDELVDALTLAAVAIGLPPEVAFGLQIFGGKKLIQLKNFSGYHMRWDDARALTLGRNSGEVLKLETDDAERAVKIDEKLFLSSLLADQGSYVARLGDHRIVMLDSSHDLGVPKNELEGLKVKLFEMGEDKEIFVGGSPNCKGVTDDDLFLAIKTLTEIQANGLFILGIHAPLFNMCGNTYPYFFRETQRESQPDEYFPFLSPDKCFSSLLIKTKTKDKDEALKDGDDVRAKISDERRNKIEHQVRVKHPDWFLGERDFRTPPFVKRGDNDDLLDHGVSRNRANDLLRALAGIDSTGIDSGRKADVVLSGHNHRHNEFRIEFDRVSKELAYFMDFYTANPASYYPTKFLYGWKLNKDDQSPTSVTAVTYVDIAADARPDAKPTPVPKMAHKYHLRVPPYPKPLSSAPDARAWWESHRPLILQTGALGPLEDSQVSFSGFRVLSIKNDVIEKIHFLSSERLEQTGYQLPWEEALRPEPERPKPQSRFNHIEKSFRINSPKATGVPSALLIPNSDTTNTVYRGADGHLYELWTKGEEAGWGDLTKAAGATGAKGNPAIFFNSAAQTLIVPYRSTDEHIHSLFWSTGAVGHDKLSESARAPRAAGDPVGYYLPHLDVHHVIYRRDNGHLLNLFWKGTEAVRFEDLTALASAPPAAGDPSAFLDTKRGDNIVVYRGKDGHIHSLFWSTGAVGHDKLSQSARAPKAAGDPVGYYTPHNDAHQVTYRGIDGHIHELWWHGLDSVRHTDLTVFARGLPSVSDPAVYCNVGTNTKHAVYRTADGHLHELWWFLTAPGGSGNTDLTSEASAPLAADQPAAFSIEGLNTQHVIYRGKDDNQIYEIHWS